ncbi:MAG: hypothetical protein R2755_13340 [Acidimicrobiales bacterium]
MCGSAEEVIDRISGSVQERLDLDRMAFMFDLGGMAEPTLCATLERFGTEVLPVVALGPRPSR